MFCKHVSLEKDKDKIVSIAGLSPSLVKDIVTSRISQNCKQILETEFAFVIIEMICHIMGTQYPHYNKQYQAVLKDHIFKGFFIKGIK